MDILVRPMQRMTKYSLLLKAILKHTEEHEQRQCLEEMVCFNHENNAHIVNTRTIIFAQCLFALQKTRIRSS